MYPCRPVARGLAVICHVDGSGYEIIIVKVPRLLSCIMAHLHYSKILIKAHFFEPLPLAT